MAQTKYTIASSALVMIGANPVSSFKPTGTTETIACYYTWQACVDHWLSLYPWRFATTEATLTRVTSARNYPGPYKNYYAVPANMKAVQKLLVNDQPAEFDRERNYIFVNAELSQPVRLIYTFEPSISIWPGYFVSLIEMAMAERLSFALSAKLDLKTDLAKQIENLFRLARNRDSVQQTTRKFRLTGRRSIMEARRN
jgi:hypothetical protein